MIKRLSILAATASLCGAAYAAPAPVAEYNFDDTLASSVVGAPALTVTDPLALSGFGSDTVFGATQQVWNFGGANSPPADQGGLTLDTTGLLTSNNVYSLEIVFKFNDRDNAWRRIVDVSSRQSDNGFYVDPNNNLDVYPVGGGATFTNGTYHDVFLVDNNGSVTFYLDGSAQATVSTTVMNIDSSNDINLFLDNLVGGGQGEWSSGSIASLSLYNAALSAPPVSAVPEPETYVMMLVGLGALGFVARGRRA
jgi:hypothetical protein